MRRGEVKGNYYDIANLMKDIPDHDSKMFVFNRLSEYFGGLNARFSKLKFFEAMFDTDNKDDIDKEIKL